jgi:hypothetical protein
MNNKRWNKGAAARRRRCYYMKNETTIKDIIEKSHKAYEGKFWNRYIREFQTWKESQKWEEKFASFCSRMWLDYSDENNTLYSYHLDKQQYINKYEDYLVKKFIENDGYV